MAAYSDEIRAEVLAAVQAGTSYRQITADLGVPQGTIAMWVRKAGIVVAGAAQVEAATNARRIAWQQRRATLVDRLGEVAAVLLDKAEAAEARDAQAFMTAVAIGVDKAQLLSGGVTSRHEQLDAERRRERVGHLRDELEDRRQAKTGTTGS